MTQTEHAKTLEALQTAIQMEIDGKEYYLNASQKSGNELGKKLLQSLAAEEDIHRHKFAEIYNTQEGNATNDAEREFYETVASEEREHHIILLDYYEYLNDPAGWFVKKERPSLDGG